MTLKAPQMKNAMETGNETSEALLNRHLNTFLENNLDALMKDYTSESVLITPEKSYTGVAEIKGYFADLMVHFPKQNSTVVLDRTVIMGDMIYIVWHGHSASVDVSFATDTFIIKDDKIFRQTLASQRRFTGN